MLEWPVDEGLVMLPTKVGFMVAFAGLCRQQPCPVFLSPGTCLGKITEGPVYLATPMAATLEMVETSLVHRYH